MDNKETVFITGATVGLGRLTAKKLINAGHVVVISGRSQEKLNAAYDFILADSPQYKDHLHGVILDLLDLKSVKDAVAKIQELGITVDVLVNNAGGTRTAFKQTNCEIEDTIFMNAIGPLYLSKLMEPLIEKSQHPNKRILFISSSLHDPSVNGGGGGESSKIPVNLDINAAVKDKKGWQSMKFYKISKLACIWDAVNLTEKYPSVPSLAFCPGFVPTTELARNSSYVLRMTLKYAISKFNFTTSEDDSTNDYIYYITTPDLKPGAYYEKRKESTPSSDASDKSKQSAYWDLCTKVFEQLKV